MKQSIDDTNKRIELLQEIDKLFRQIAFKDHPHSKIDHSKSWLPWIVWAIGVCSVVPIYILSWLNPCLTYASVLRGVSLSLFIVSVIFVAIHLWMYNQITEFCTETAKVNHHLHSIILFTSMGATLAWLDYYTYNPDPYAFIGAFILSMVSFFEYFLTLAQRHHFLDCTMGGTVRKDGDQKMFYDWSYSDTFLAMSTLFCFTWGGFMICSVSLSDPIVDSVKRASHIEEGCAVLVNTTSISSYFFE